MTILLVEQNANMALHVADNGYVPGDRHYFYENASGLELLQNESVKEAYLGKSK